MAVLLSHSLVFTLAEECAGHSCPAANTETSGASLLQKATQTGAARVIDDEGIAGPGGEAPQETDPGTPPLEALEKSKAYLYYDNNDNNDDNDNDDDNDNNNNDMGD